MTGVVYLRDSLRAGCFIRRKGLTHQQIVSAVLKGLERGRKDFGISSGLIICAMRNMNTSLEMAELAVDFRARGVVGSIWQAKKAAIPRKSMWMPFITSSARTSTSQFMLAKAMEKNRSGRRFSIVGHIGSAMARA